MPQFLEMYNRQRKWILYLLSIYVLGWGFTAHQSVFLGLILGTVFSFIILQLLVRRMKKFDKAVDQGKKVRSLGSLQRLAVAAIAIMIALKWPNYFSAVSVVLGLMTTYIVIIIDYLFHAFYVHK